MMNRRERERQQHRHDIIVAARRVFAARGYTDTTMEDVAAAAEFGKGTIYNYFTGKEELFGSVIDDTLEELTRIVNRSLDDDATPFTARIETLTRAMLTYAVESPASLFLVARELRLPVLGTRAGDAVARLMEPVTHSIAAEQNAGRLVRDIEPLVLGQVLMNMILGRFLSMIRARMAGAGEQEHRYTAMTGTGADETALRRELEQAVAVVCRVFLNGALIADENLNRRPRKQPSTDQ